ncbi:MAG: ABC transporter ATP-binding protein [Candidatus Eremiobacteraeota bacterium]|nr:ABC transporter ATP-binding protein [Candidatus Eremiobacteraeota bacterium]
MSALLEVRELEVRYGGIVALRGIDLRVEEGEIVALLGANGAGKTTTLRAISGLLPIRSGDVAFDGASLRRRPPDAVARLGIGHVPEGRRVFTRMTVRENLELGGFAIASRREATQRIDDVLDIFPRLRDRLAQRAGTLSGGEQQMLAIGRALIARPRLLLLDEPSLGLAPLVVKQIFEVLHDIHDRGTTIVLVEQNARAALALADRGYVLRNGEIARGDTAAALSEDPAVVAAYLGG